MGLKDNELSNPSVSGNYIENQNYSIRPVIDFEIAGIGFQDPSQGLEVQNWTARTDGSDITIEAENTPAFVAYSGSDITEISLSFDSNMNYAVAFIEAGEAKFKWFDSSISDFTVSNYGSSVINPRCTMDDKREFNDSGRDIILAYLRDGNLYYREQRDRYQTEYLLSSGNWTTLLNIGMSTKLRMQFTLVGTSSG